MDTDCKFKRAKFIDSSIEVREMFHFAKPSETLKAIQVKCCDSYGSMLWLLQSETAESFFKSWNTAVKLVWNVPRDTYTYLTEGYFGKGFHPLRNQVLGRYPSFFQKLLNSPSKEVALLARIVGRDPRSVTFKNLKYVDKLAGLSPWDFSSKRIKVNLPVKSVPDNELWRTRMLDTLIDMRQKTYLMVEDSQHISAMISSLCNT